MGAGWDPAWDPVSDPACADVCSTGLPQKRIVTKLKPRVKNKSLPRRVVTERTDLATAGMPIETANNVPRTSVRVGRERCAVARAPGRAKHNAAPAGAILPGAVNGDDVAVEPGDKDHWLIVDRDNSVAAAVGLG